MPVIFAQQNYVIFFVATQYESYFLQLYVVVETYTLDI